MREEQKLKWTCHECRSRVPKVGNLNTPVRNVKEDYVDVSGSEIQDSELGNVTLRRKQGDCNQKPRINKNSTSPTQNTQDLLVAAVSEQVHNVIKKELPGLISNIIKTELSSVRQDLQDFRKSIDFISISFDEMKTVVDQLAKDNITLTKENSTLKSTVSELSERLNNLEQHLREDNLEMQGVPEHRAENLCNLVEQCSRIVGYSFKEEDIVKCTRVAKQNKESKLPRAIIIKFRNVRKRDEFYSAVYRYNKTNPNNKLNTSVLGISGDQKPVYISEHLSPANKMLHAEARKKAKELGYKFVWIKNGRIYVRKQVDSQYIVIKNKESLGLIC